MGAYSRGALIREGRLSKNFNQNGGAYSRGAVIREWALIRAFTVILIVITTMNIYRIDRLNKNGGLMFYYQLNPFALIKVNHQIFQILK